MARSFRIGNLTIGYDADSTKFDSATKRVTRRITATRKAFNRLRGAANNLNARMNSLVRSFLSVRAVVGALAGGAGLGAVVKGAADAGASIFELSQRSGIAVDKLQLLLRTFEGEGVAADKAGKAIQTFAQKANEAAQGVATYADIFERLGVKVTGADGQVRPIYDLLLDVADGMASLGSHTERTALTIDLFGTRAAGMLNALLGGKRTLEETIESYRRLGVWSDKTAAELKVLAQAFTDTGNAWTAGLGNAVAKAGPQFFYLLRMAQELAASLAENLVNAIVWVGENFQGISVAAKALGIIFIATRKSVTTLIAGLVGMIPAMAAAATGGRLLAGSFLAAQAAARSLGRVLIVGLIIEGIILAINHTQKFKDLWASLADVVTSLWHVISGWLARVEMGFARVAGKIKGFFTGDDTPLGGDVADQVFKKRIEAGEIARAKLRGQMGKMVDDVKGLGKAWADSWRLWGTQDVEGPNLDGIKSEYDELVKKLLEDMHKLGDKKPWEAATDGADKFKKELTQVERAIDKISSGISDAFTGAVEDIVTGTEKAKHALRGLLQEIIRVALRAAVLDPIGETLGSGLKTGLTSLLKIFSPGPAAGVPTPLGGVDYMAEGGPVVQGRSYIVGERGPEAFVPGVTGRILSNDELTGGRTGDGGVTVNFNPTIIGGNREVVREELRRALPQFVQVAEGVILQKQNRPSAQRQTLRGS